MFDKTRKTVNHKTDMYIAESLPIRWFREWMGTIQNSLSIAASTLWTHKLRSLLTIFGIVTGIAAVVLIGATLDVVRTIAAKSTAQTIGADTFIISQVASVGDLSRKDLARKMRIHPEIYRREGESFALRSQEIARTAPGLSAIADVKAGNKTFRAASITGSTTDIQFVRNIELSSGRFFAEIENRRSNPVAIIGQDLANELFPSVDPLNKSIRIKGQAFRVIGIQAKQGSSFASSLDRNVYMPLLAYEKIWGSRRSVTLYIQPYLPENIRETMEQSRMIMRILRRIRPSKPDNFDLLTPEAGRSFLDRIIGVIGTAIVPISSVALIVAGIVVMNMMLVSVTERTREIGIRKALGARNRDIFAEILLESALLTVIGGVIGLSTAYIGAFGLSRIFDASVRISHVYALLAFAISTIIGFGAGFFPAWLASRLPPVEALRYET
jgi:putative ABC transport system permease protein